MALPQNAVIRRINELVKRARSVKVHAYIIHYLKKQMPYMVGKSEKQRKLLDRLDRYNNFAVYLKLFLTPCFHFYREFLACARRYNLPLGDFPNVDKYRKMLGEIKDISDFKRLDKNLVYDMDKVLTVDIPLLLRKASPPQTAASHPQHPSKQQQQQPYYDYNRLEPPQNRPPPQYGAPPTNPGYPPTQW